MAIVGKPSPTIPFTSPAKRKMPETMSSSLMANNSYCGLSPTSLAILPKIAIQCS